MGTSWSVLVVGPPAEADAQLRHVLDGVVAQMSQWRPDSVLSRFNRTPPGEWQDLPADLATVLEAALGIWRETDGAFDPAAGALADLWGFGPPGPRTAPPDDRAIAGALARSGAAAIELDGTRARRHADVALDLSGIAKGYAVDLLARRLRSLGAEDFLVEIGGEFVGAGIKPDGQPWWVALEDPTGVALDPLRVALHGLAVATSGDYRRFLAHEGRRLGHSFDPRTGRPVANGVVSVSVIAPDCIAADAWATALTVLGPDDGMAMAAHNDLAARMVLAGGEELLSPALEAMLEN